MRARSYQFDRAIKYLFHDFDGKSKSYFLFVQGDRLLGKSKFLYDLKSLAADKTKYKNFIIDQPVFEKKGLFDIVFNTFIENIVNNQDPKENDALYTVLLDFLVESNISKKYALFKSINKKKIKKQLEKSKLRGDYSILANNLSRENQYYLLEYALSNLYGNKVISFFIDNIANEDLLYLKKALIEYERHYRNIVNINILFSLPTSKVCFSFINEIISILNKIKIDHIWLHPLYLEPVDNVSVEKSLTFSPIIPGIVNPKDIKSDVSPNAVYRKICDEIHYSVIDTQEINNLNPEKHKFLVALSFFGYLRSESIHSINMALKLKDHEIIPLFNDSEILCFCKGKYYFWDSWRAYLTIRLLKDKYFYYLNQLIAGSVQHGITCIEDIRERYISNEEYINPHINRCFAKVLKQLFKLSKGLKKGSQAQTGKRAYMLYLSLKEFGTNRSSIFIEGIRCLFEYSQNLEILEFGINCIESRGIDNSPITLEFLICCLKNSFKFHDTALAQKSLRLTRLKQIFSANNHEIYINRLKTICLFLKPEDIEKELFLYEKFGYLDNCFDIICDDLIKYLEDIGHNNLKYLFEWIHFKYISDGEPEMSNPKKTKILFIAANPKDSTHLRIDEEIRKIKTNLKQAKERDNLEFIPELAITTDTLMQAILDESPDILHFSGHGKQEGIIIEDEAGNRKMIKGDALLSLLALFKKNIKCVLLNSCYSESQAKEIKKYIPFVIGMNSTIPDKAAIAFSVGFYKAIGAGKDVKFAFTMGKASIKLEGIDGCDIPILL